VTGCFRRIKYQTLYSFKFRLHVHPRNLQKFEVWRRLRCATSSIRCASCASWPFPKMDPKSVYVVAKAMYYSTRGRKWFKYMEGGSKHPCSFVTWPISRDMQLYYPPLKGELPLFTHLSYKVNSNLIVGSL